MNRRGIRARQELKRSQHADYVRDEKRKALGRISERFPNLASVRLSLAFGDPDRVIP